jgi:hypothetical protein
VLLSGVENLGDDGVLGGGPATAKKRNLTAAVVSNVLGTANTSFES